MASDLPKLDSGEEDQEVFIERLLLESAFGCHRERVPNACEQLGNLLTTFKKDYDGAKDVHKRNCDELKFSRSCFAYAKLVDSTAKAIGNEDPKTEALNYYGASCDTGNSRGCFVAGVRYSNPLEDKRDYKTALKYYIKGCNTFEHHSCFSASEFYRQGKVVNKDMTQALKFAQQACECGSLKGCINAHLMHKQGDGVPQSEELAQKYKDLGTVLIRRDIEMKRMKNDLTYQPSKFLADKVKLEPAKDS